MHTLTVFDGTTKYSVPFEDTPTVQQVLEGAGIAIPHPCGGMGICGKCGIEVIGNISLPDKAELTAGYRLSCRTRLYGNAIVTLKHPSCSAKASLIAEGYSGTIAPSGHPEKAIGAAVDIGTTTIALSVYNLTTGHCLAAKSVRNPQSVVSADVMGRIDAAIKGKLSELQHMLHSSIRTLAEATGYFDRIDTWCLTGNTTMLYLLCGRTPQSLAAAPYIADHLFGEEITFFDKPAYLPDCMHAFVGADITCAVLASGMCDNTETALLCDIGTNGEIVLWKNGTLYVTSTAAGPVFEGAGISCGCQSVTGAIERVTRHNGALSVTTIGNQKPIGICGSGIIDAIACFLENGTLDETGAMEDDAIDLCKGISITRADIRNIQLAKAAIAAGIRILMEVTKTSEEEISAFYLAGGFGKHLNLDSATRIGLFPAKLKDKVKVLGNAALQGAATMLTEETLKEKAKNISIHVKHITLGGTQKFNELYIKEMYFFMEE
ncbi:MAG: DUF4445 domain-containing protein [Lachnospiraceae bacterium]|nr:DUF4445 domain-containing protein [Lachnospiraceae bacterium]